MVKTVAHSLPLHPAQGEFFCGRAQKSFQCKKRLIETHQTHALRQTVQRQSSTWSRCPELISGALQSSKTAGCVSDASGAPKHALVKPRCSSHREPLGSAGTAGSEC